MLGAACEMQTRSMYVTTDKVTAKKITQYRECVGVWEAQGEAMGFSVTGCSRVLSLGFFARRADLISSQGRQRPAHGEQAVFCCA
jgi:hypothetical protein